MDATPALLANYRLVSDASRFEYEQQHPRNRSRNASPAEIHSSPLSLPIAESPRPIHDIPFLNPGSSAYEMRDDLYDFYARPSHASLRGGASTPYPGPSIHNQLENPPLPPKDTRSPYIARRHLQAVNDDLPAIQDTREYLGMLLRQIPGHERGIVAPPRHQYDQEELLLARFMNMPLFRSRYAEDFDPGHVSNYIFTANNVIDFFQIAFGVIITTIASVLTSIDNRIDGGFYRYFIAVGVIVLVVALLFISKTINFERRKGVFYCVVSCILTAVALILSITSIATNNNCATKQICQMRKVLATFSILSFILWICTLMVFLTTFYIAKLILNDRINLDYNTPPEPRMSHDAPIVEKLRPSTYYKEDSTIGYQTDADLDDLRFSRSMHNLPRYTLDENGKMYPLERSQDLRGTKPLIVYAPEELLF